MNKKRWIVAVALVLFTALLVAFDRIGSWTAVSTMHWETNYLAVVTGDHVDSQYRKINPSNLVAVQNTVLLPRTNLAGLTIGGAAKYLPITNFFTETNIWINPTARVFRVTLTNNFGIVFTNAPDVVAEFRLELQQDSTGSRTGTTNSPNWRFGQEITGLHVSTNANSITYLHFITRGTNFVMLGGPLTGYFD